VRFEPEPGANAAWHFQLLETPLAGEPLVCALCTSSSATAVRIRALDERLRSTDTTGWRVRASDAGLVEATSHAMVQNIA
jgi:hypothetical protein